MNIIKKFLAIAIAGVTALSFAACSELPQEKDFYDITVTYSDEGYIFVDMNVDTTLKANSDAVCFNAYPNAYRDGAGITPLKKDDGKGSFAVNAVTVDKNASVCELVGSDENVLRVSLGKTRNVGERVKIGIKYTAKLSLSDERMSRFDGGANLGNFFPTLCVYDGDNYVFCEYGAVGDPFFSEIADYKVKLVLPGKYVVASGANATSCDVGEDQTSYSYSFENVRDVAFVINDKFSVLQEKSGDRSINYYFYSDSDPENTISALKKSLEFFSEKFGDYPFDTYAAAETPFDAGGMEYPRLVYLAETADRENYLLAAVHETAHQWWYSLVGNDQTKEPFLDESLAEYSTYVFFDEHPEFGINAEELYNAKKSGCAYVEHALMSLYSDYSGKVGRRLDEFYNAFDYVNAVYDKGFLMMKAAEDTVGRAKVLRNLKKYCSENAYKTADTAAFLASMGSAKGVIEPYLDGKVFIPLA